MYCKSILNHFICTYQNQLDFMLVTKWSSMSETRQAGQQRQESRVSLKAPLVMVKLLPPIFLFHLVQSLGFFREFFLTIFFTPCNFWPPKYHKGPPLGCFFSFFSCRNGDLDSSKEGFRCTECNSKNLSSLQSTISKKIK